MYLLKLNNMPKLICFNTYETSSNINETCSNIHKIYHMVRCSLLFIINHCCLLVVGRCR